MLSIHHIFDTIDMIDKRHLDIRTITMGISLLDCVSEDPKRCCEKIYDKICRRAQHLVRTGEEIQGEFGIPIVNKRISVTPMALVAGGCDTEDYVPFAHAMDRAAKTCGVAAAAGHSTGTGGDGYRLLQHQCGLHQGGHQHGRRGPHGAHHQGDGPSDP